MTSSISHRGRKIVIYGRFDIIFFETRFFDDKTQFQPMFTAILSFFMRFFISSGDEK
ncbi:MAG: hypothetical protein JWR26_500 [Pedosphaera sp.]|nr:hypothetical protein [Pedosphaera sp.]